MDFKLLAIKPLAACHIRYRKILQPGHTYFLYNNYEISDLRIDERETELPENLYSPEGKAKVNVSAIVGKNGSGKSSLVELFFGAIYIAAIQFGIVSEHAATRKRKPTGIAADIYWKLGEDYFLLSCAKGGAILKRQQGAKGQFKGVSINATYRTNTSIIKNLFYTIAVNYSHYALNSGQGSRWLDDIFQKNDGYQLPLVINPYRNNGVIDINNEESLMIPRIIANLLTIRDGQTLFSELAPRRFAEKIKFTLNTKKIQFSGEVRDVADLLQ